jgi:hypothetical protein
VIEDDGPGELNAPVTRIEYVVELPIYVVSTVNPKVEASKTINEGKVEKSANVEE